MSAYQPDDDVENNMSFLDLFDFDAFQRDREGSAVPTGEDNTLSDLSKPPEGQYLGLSHPQSSVPPQVSWKESDPQEAPTGLKGDFGDFGAVVSSLSYSSRMLVD